MACGLPIVSTRVGIVEEAFGPLQREFIVSHRTVSAFEAGLRRLIEDPALRARVGAENLEYVTQWDWNRRIASWQRFIEGALRQDIDPHAVDEQASLLGRAIELAGAPPLVDAEPGGRR